MDMLSETCPGQILYDSAHIEGSMNAYRASVGMGRECVGDGCMTLCMHLLELMCSLKSG
jgi:hypothetical protein